MTSQIVSSTLDEDFPVAGQDNDSQGFRDNFSVIKTGLETAASEISVLQETTAKLGSEENNDFLGGIISNVQLSNAYRITAAGSVTNNDDVNVESGDYIKVVKSDGVQAINVVWPENENGNYIKIRLEVTADIPPPSTGTISIYFNTETPITTIKSNFNNSVGNGILLEHEDTAIFDCWIAGENTQTMFIQHIETFE